MAPEPSRASPGPTEERTASPGLVVLVVETRGRQAAPAKRCIPKMKLLDSVNGVAAHIQAAVDVARGKDHPAAQIIKLRECLQTASERVLTLREQVTALEREKAKLEERLAERERFEHERGEFVARKLETGSVVYVRKGSGQGEDDPVIHYCAHCFKRGEQEILQLEE